MKNTTILLLLTLIGSFAHAQDIVKTGVYHSYRSFENNKPSGETDYQLTPFIRINKIDRNYNDTLYRLVIEGKEVRKAFGVFDGSRLYVSTEDSLYRKMDYAGRYAFVSVTNKIHFDEGYVIENKTPIWKEDRDEVHTYLAFVNKQGNLEVAGFESMWALLKGDNDLSKPFGKEKHVYATFKRYLLLMNERYPIK